jgi:hypothetical protein
MKPANDFWHPLNARRAHDIGDVCDDIWTKFNASFAGNFNPSTRANGAGDRNRPHVARNGDA